MNFITEKKSNIKHFISAFLCTIMGQGTVSGALVLLSKPLFRLKDILLLNITLIVGFVVKKASIVHGFLTALWYVGIVSVN
ncbi:hypothetical protein DGG96_18095 [Legionella qingyii]|uniref:Uncharacterized protein n=1 Tax=Legionella qingyii TaxID=2184757 RepID=A0A317U0B2_9GAMM|nr:hypothetical protein DGG96_18095 [Legionella qingyii]